jgi:hypothetical protein
MKQRPVEIVVVSRPAAAIQHSLSLGVCLQPRGGPSVLNLERLLWSVTRHGRMSAA